MLINTKIWQVYEHEKNIIQQTVKEFCEIYFIAKITTAALSIELKSFALNCVAN